MKSLVFTLLAFLVTWQTTQAEVSMPKFFSDNMVLQRERPIRIWGRSVNGESVTVRFAGSEVSVQADRTGRWEATLPAMAADATPREMTVTGRADTVRFTNVVVGDVWLCSGQSNMEWRLDPTTDCEAEIAASANPNIRLLSVGDKIAFEERSMSWNKKNNGFSEPFAQNERLKLQRPQKTKMRWMKMKKIVSFLLALMLALSLAACSAKPASSDSASMASDSYDFNGAELPDAKYDDTASDDGAWNGQEVSSAGADLAERGVKMVYIASIEMQTLEFDQAAQDIASLVESMGGYFEQKNFSNYSSSYRHASYTVRVPAEQFTDFCTQVGTLCHVTWQSDTAENISERYYDTQSRLETAQIKLERLQELLKKAESMEDIITIESAISETEYEIEDLSGTMRHYDALVGYATVDLELSEVYRLSGTEDAPKSFGEKLANAFTDGLAATGQTLEDFAVWLAYSWLDVLIFAAVVFVAVKLIGRLRRGKKLPKPVRKKKNAETPADETKTEE